MSRCNILNYYCETCIRNLSTFKPPEISCLHTLPHPFKRQKKKKGTVTKKGKIKRALMMILLFN